MQPTENIHLTIICVSDPEHTTKLVMNDTQSVSDLKAILRSQFEPNMRLIYAGKLLNDSDILSAVIKQEEAHIHLVGTKKSKGKEKAPEPVEKTEQPKPEVPTAVSSELFKGLYSPTPIDPQIVNINGILYSVKTGPPITFAGAPQPTVTIPATTVPNPGPNGRVFGVRVVMNMEHVWLVFKLAFALYILGRGSSWTRTIFLGLVAMVLFFFQTRARAIPERPAERNQNADAPNPPAPTENVENAMIENPAPRTLLGELSALAASFFASMIPEQPPQQPQQAQDPL